MLRNALRRTPGSGTSFICLFCKPASSSTTAPLRLSPLRGSSTTPTALRSLTTTPQYLKNTSGSAKRKSKAKAKAKSKAAAAAAADADAAPPSEASALDEMRKGIDAIVAKQLAVDPPAPPPKKKKAKKGSGAKTIIDQDGKKRAVTRMVPGVRRKEMTLADAMARGGARRRSVVAEEEEEKPEENVAPRPKGLKVIDPDGATLEPIKMQGHTNPPKIHHDLDRVLFNPGVHYLQDPRSRVYNFEPYLRDIMPVHEFDFEAVDSYITSSKDTRLEHLAKSLGKKYSGSTSSMTAILSHFHYLLSHWRSINAESLSKTFPVEYRSFTQLSRAPVATFLRYKGDGTYAIDADKEFDTDSILSLLGRSLEKMLTLSPADYESLRRANAAERTEDFAQHPDTFHYSTLGDFLMRSQLDAYDPRLPGTGMFDLKTRAVVSVRMDVANFHLGSGYQIKTLKGQWESFEREYFDMIRAAFLKYSLQVRMGRMDGIFVAFHNTERIFGFQYIGLDEMDGTIHGGYNSGVGDKEFKASLVLLNKILDRATEKFPEQSLRLHFETRETQTPQMYIIAEPVSEEQIEKIQNRNARDMSEFLKSLEKKRDSVLKKAESKRIAEKFGIIEEDAATAAEEEAEKIEEAAAQDAEASAVQDVEEAEAVEEAEVLEEQYEQGQQGLEISLETESVVTVEEEAVLEAREETAGEITEEVLEEVSEEATGVSGGPGVTLEEILKGTLEVSDETPEESSEFTSEEDLEESAYESTDSTESGTAEATETSSKTTTSKPSQPPILAMTLTTYNLVNNRAVVRPDYLTEHDKWTIEYNMVEAPSNDRAWNTYNSIKVRRKKAVEQKLLAEDSDEVSGYVKYLRVLSKEGRTWAAGQEKRWGKETVVYKAGGHLE